MVERWTHDVFAQKNIMVFSVPSPFYSDYPASMLQGYEYHFEAFLNLGINEVFCTSNSDFFVLNNWFKSEGVEKIKVLPDGNSQWAESIGFLTDMTESFLGNRTHRYVMIIENLKLKAIRYEDFCADPHVAYVETYPEKTLEFLKTMQESWQKFEKEDN